MRAAPAPGLARRLCGLGLWLAALAGPAAAQDEVPFVTTPDAVTLAMLQLAGVGPARLSGADQGAARQPA